MPSDGFLSTHSRSWKDVALFVVKSRFVVHTGSGSQFHICCRPFCVFPLVQCHFLDMIPVSCCSRPSFRIPGFCSQIDLVAFCKYFNVFAVVPVCWGYKPNAAMKMFIVIPMGKKVGPIPGLIQVAKRLLRVFGPIVHRPEK